MTEVLDELKGAQRSVRFKTFSLSVLFVVTLFVALLVRRNATRWNPGIVPAFPSILWANTVILLASSATLHEARLSQRFGSR